MASLSSIIAKAKIVTYRVQGVPVDYDEELLRNVLQDLLGLDETAQLHVHSLCQSPYRDGLKVATFTFKGHCDRLKVANDKTMWEFFDSQTIKENGKFQRIKVPLVVDSHFLGFTPLNECTEKDQDQIE